MRKLYINEENTLPTSTCLVYAWMKKEGVDKSYTSFPTYSDERGDEFCKELEKDPNFIGWCRNPWTGEVLLTNEEMEMFRKYLTDWVLNQR